MEGEIPPVIDGDGPLLHIAMLGKNAAGSDFQANSEGKLLDKAAIKSGRFRVLIKAPAAPGTYRVQVKWGMAAALIAAGELEVQK